jgi:hypothetical protein
MVEYIFDKNGIQVQFLKELRCALIFILRRTP